MTVGLVLTITLVAFEALAIATIMPLVGRHLGDLRLYGWAFSAFMLASLVGIVQAGALADRGPLRLPMMVGVALFAAGLAIGGTAPDMAVLVTGRMVQGLGAGFVPTVAYVAISRGYPEPCRPRMFAVLSTAWVVPGLVGPAIAALVATTVGWRWVFLGCIPLVIVAGSLAIVALGQVPPPANPGKTSASYLPVLAVVLGAGVALASPELGRRPRHGCGHVCGGTLVVFSLRLLTPPGTLVAARGLPATIVGRGLLTCCFFAGDAYIPYALITVRRSPTVMAALALVASTMTWTAASWLQARWVRRAGPRHLVRCGELLILAGLALSRRWPIGGGAARGDHLGLGGGGCGDRLSLCPSFGGHPRCGRGRRGRQGDVSPPAFGRAGPGYWHGRGRRLDRRRSRGRRAQRRRSHGVCLRRPCRGGRAGPRGSPPGPLGLARERSSKVARAACPLANTRARSSEQGYHACLPT